MAEEDAIATGTNVAHVADSSAGFVAVDGKAKSDNAPAGVRPSSGYVAPAPDPTAAAPKKGGAGYLVCKRAFDIVFSAGVCVLVAIPVAVACAAIAIESPGKPFFRQERVGQNGKPIHIFKLRTMVSDAHTNPQKYMTPEQFAVWDREQKLPNDPRVTKVGRALRGTSLDELPQFLNVLTGDIPLRILKMRPEFSVKCMGTFALPAKSSTNEETVFSQAVKCFVSGLRTCRCSDFDSSSVGGVEAQFLAKPFSGAVRA